jgi:Formate/nitrite transporter
MREPSRQESMTDPAAALQDDDLPAAPPASLDALMPPQIAAKAADIGVAKANADAFSTLVLSVLAGAFIALGAAFATTAAAGAAGQLPFGVTRVPVGVVFSLGLILVVVACHDRERDRRLADGRTGLLGCLPARPGRQVSSTTTPPGQRQLDSSPASLCRASSGAPECHRGTHRGPPFLRT